MPETINADIRSFILKAFPLAKKRQVADSDPLLESGILDSQGVLDVVAFLEQQFSVHIEDDDLVPANFETIHRMVAFVRSKAASDSAGAV